MRNLLVDGPPVVTLPLVVVVLVAVVLVGVLVVLVLPCDLENYLVFLLLVQVVRVNQLELRIVADVVVLVHLHVLFNDVQGHCLLLNQELRVLVLQERSEVLVLPCRGLLWVKKRVSAHHLQLVVSVIGSEVRVRHQLGVQVEFVSCEWVYCHKCDSVSLWVLDVSNVLDGLLKDLVLA